MNRRPKIVYNANPSCEGHCVPTLHAGSEEIPFLHNPHVRGGGHNLKFLFCAKMHSTVTQSSGFFKFNFLIQNSLCLCADFVLNWLWFVGHLICLIQTVKASYQLQLNLRMHFHKEWELWILFPITYIEIALRMEEVQLQLQKTEHMAISVLFWDWLEKIWTYHLISLAYMFILEVVMLKILALWHTLLLAVTESLV